MGRKTGVAIPEEKIELVRQIAREEFTKNGYQGTSTNIIIQRAQISKGSLFNLFGNKKNLYFELIRQSSGFFVNQLEMKLKKMPRDYVERMLWIGDLYLNMFIKEPELFSFLMTLTDVGNRDLAFEFYSEHMSNSLELQGKMFTGIDESSLKIDSARMMKITTWVLTEIKNDIFSNPEAIRDPKKFKDDFMEELDEMLQILKHGMYK